MDRLASRRAMKLLVSKIIFVFTLAVLAVGCLDINSQYTIVYPESGGVYVGFENARPACYPGCPIELMENEFVIAYDNNPSGDVVISLNNTDVSSFFSFSATEAQASINDLQQFIRQGQNTLSVDALSFGPSINFYADFAGPDIVITEADIAADGNPNTLLVNGFLRDASGYDNASLVINSFNLTYQETSPPTIQEAASGNAEYEFTINTDGSFSGVVDIADDLDMYKFEALDKYGYVSSVKFAADSQAQNSVIMSNAVNVAVGDSFVASLRPIISAQLAETALEVNCFDTSSEYYSAATCASLTDLTAKIPVPLLGEIDTDISVKLFRKWGPEPGYNIDLGEGSKYVDNPFDQTGNIYLNGFDVRENDRLGINATVKYITAAVDVTAHIPLVFFTIPLGMALPLDIERVDVDGEALVKVREYDNEGVTDGSNPCSDSGQKCKGSIWVDIVDGTSVALSGMSDSQASDDQGILTAVIGWILGTGLLDGLISGLVPDIIESAIEENMNTLIISFLLSPDTLVVDENNDLLEGGDSPRFNTELLTVGMGTEVNGDQGDFVLRYDAQFDILQVDSNVKPSIGSVFVNDPIDPAEVLNVNTGLGSNLSVAISSNFINQGLNAVYAVGATHLTVFNGELETGATLSDLSDGTRVNQTRIRLWPDMSPVFGMGGIDNTEDEAFIEYQSATMYLDAWKDVNGTLQWVNQAEFSVDFKVAARVGDYDGVFRMSTYGSPIFNVNAVKVSEDFPIPINQPLVQLLIDVVFGFVMPTISNEYAVLDLGNFAEETLAAQPPVEYLDANDNLRTEKLAFEITTDEVRAAGVKKNNLLFQMKAIDPRLPPAPVFPFYDFDEDGVNDYQDNCRVSQISIEAAIDQAEANGFTVPDYEFKTGVNDLGEQIYIYEDGQPVLENQAAVDAALAAQISYVKGILNQELADYYNNGNAPDQSELDWWNHMRTNNGSSDSILTMSDISSAPWLIMLYSNTSQHNTDGDRIGELCEVDDDRDGVYVDNVPTSIQGTASEVNYVDNCAATQQLDGGALWTASRLASGAYRNATDTDLATAAGDLCDPRKTYIMIGSYGSEETDGQKMCYAHSYPSEVRCGPGYDPADYQGLAEGAGNGVCYRFRPVTAKTDHDVERLDLSMPCDESDVRQRWYLSPVDIANNQYRFYTNENRTGTRLVTNGNRNAVHTGSLPGGEIDTFEFKAANVDINSTREQIDNPWYVYSTGILGGNECMMYKHWSIDFDADLCLSFKAESYGSPGISAENDYRFSIRVGPNQDPWNGQW